MAKKGATIEIPDLIEYQVRLKNAAPTADPIKVLANHVSTDVHWVTLSIELKDTDPATNRVTYRRNVTVAAFASNMVLSVRAS